MGSAAVGYQLQLFHLPCPVCPDTPSAPERSRPTFCPGTGEKPALRMHHLNPSQPLLLRHRSRCQ